MHDDFFPRRSRREVYIVNLSSDDCDEGATAAVPFNWESEPGTPKVKCREIPCLPPLTPPPSYFYSTPKRTVKHHSKPKLLDTILPKRLRRKPRVQHSPVSSSPSSSTSSSRSSTSSSRSSSPWPRSYSGPSSPMGASNLYPGNELARSKLFSESSADKEDREYEYCAASTPCFGGGARAVSRGFCSTMLKALLRDK